MEVSDGDSNRGSNCHGEFAKYCNNGKPKSKAELMAMRDEGKPCKNCHIQPGATIGGSPWTTSVPVTLSLSLGSTGSVPDYYGDYPNDTNVPSFPGGNTQPNQCLGGPAAVLCLASIFESLVPRANIPNTTSNFFVHFNVNYAENGPASVSDIEWMSQYPGKAVFKFLKINDNYVHRGNTYMLPANSNLISGIYYSDNNGIQITGIVETLINTPNGRGGWPYQLIRLI
jgi:hypothetical protein